LKGGKGLFKNFPVIVDTAQKSKLNNIVVNSNDLNTLKLSLTINQLNKPIDLTGATVRIAIVKPDKKTVFQDCTITDPTKGSCEVVLNTQAFIISGVYIAEVMIYFDADKVAVTGRFSYSVAKGILDNTTEESKNDWQSITQAISDAEGILIDLRENGTGVDAQARSELETVTTQLADTVKKHGDKVSVKEYDNLVINGDWTNAFQNAFQNATFVDVPDGDYMINDQILKNTGKKLVLTISKGANFKAGNSFPTGKSLFKVDGLERFVLNGLIMDGNWSYRGFADWTNYIHGIEVKNITKKVTIKECEISNYPSIAIQVLNSNNVHISGNVIENGQFHGIEVKDCVFSHIGRNRIVGIGNAGANPIKGGIGVLVTKGQKAYIYRNDVSNMSDTAMKTEGTDHVIFSGNTAVDSGKDGIKVMSHSSIFPSFAKVINNTVLRINEWRPDGTSLIAIQSIKKSIVQGNILEGGNKTGLQVENGVRVNSIDGVVYSEDSTVSNNVIKNTNSESIYIDKVKKISITDNSTEHGINVINSLSSLKVKGNSLTPVSVKSNIVGIQVFNSVNVDISNNEISKFLNGILVSPGLLTKRITLKDNDISDLDGYPIRVKNYGTDLAVINLLDISDNRMINVAQVNNISEAISVSILNSNYKFLKLRDNLLQSEGTGTISYMFQVLDTGTNITNAILKDNVSNSNRQVLKNKITNILEQVVA
jgi:hypothetical protein